MKKKFNGQQYNETDMELKQHVLVYTVLSGRICLCILYESMHCIQYLWT